MIPKKPDTVTWTDDQWCAIYEDNQNILVSAGAGSGKTAVLTERVIRKITDGIDINRLLVLTFTNEAAKEMKSRIRESITKKNLAEQLELLESAYITTFDSFALSIVKKYHYLLNISKQVTNLDSSIVSIKKQEIIDEIFEEYYGISDEFKELITIYCYKDDKKIKDAILDISNELDKKIDKQEYLDNYINNYFRDQYIESLIDEYLILLQEKIIDIKENYYNLISYLEGKQIESFNIFDSLFNANDYDTIKEQSSINLPRLNKACDEAKEYKEELNKNLKELKNLTRFASIDEIKESLKLNEKYIKVIIEIIKKLDKKINDYKYEHDAYEFNDIATMAIKVVKENKEVQTELKNYFNEIMLDEYQDTSDIQETFISLIANNNVYCVGDQKQSIYRFRNANPFIFSNKYNEYSKNINGIKIDLKDNFRSRNEVIDSINNIFSNIMDNEIGNAEYKESHQMIFGNKKFNLFNNNQNNYLEIYNYEINKKYQIVEQEAFIIAHDIKNKINSNYLIFDKELRPITYSDICIIVDRSSTFDTIKKIFEYNQIPLTVCKDQSLTAGHDLNVIRSLLNLVIKVNNNEFDNEFKYYYTSVARSFLFSYDDNEIYNCIKNNDFNNEIINIAKTLNINETTPIMLLDDIIDKYNIYEKLILIGNVEESIIKIESLQQIARSLTEQNYTPDMFLSYLNEMIDNENDIKYKVNTSIGNNIKIMTIHASKGLQFNLCYFLGYNSTFNMEDTKESIFYDNKYGIIMPYYNEGIDNLITKELSRKNYINEEISEKIRLLYVALTRAKEKMIIVTPLKENKKFNNLVPKNLRKKYRSFNDILSSIDLSKYVKNVEVNVDKNYINQKLSDLISLENKEKLINKEIKINYSLKEENHFSKTTNKLLTKEDLNAMEYGTKMHYIFETEDFETTTNKNVINLLKQIDKPINVYKEHEFIYVNDNKEEHGIIDLLLEYKDHFKIIDYKLKNITDESYIKQIKGYQKYIENITKKQVKTYLYSIIENKLTEI